MNPSLSEQYEEKVRPCIDLIDSLRALGVEKDLALPAIAVIGDQGSGKSSVLEALSGVALPRGNGMVTRCPLELRMSRNKNFWHGTIQCGDYKKQINNSADVEETIKEAQKNIAGAVGISDKLISLEVSSADVPDLTLIDLPGIVCMPITNQPENIAKQIKRLIRKFIENQGTIILVVMPCNVDIATNEALKMAHEVDPDGKRTIGILTKPDLVDKGKEEMVVSIINNEITYLTKGFMIVRCRGQQEIQDCVTLYEAIETEKDFFEKHPQFSTLYDEGKATIPSLAEKLTLELVYHIEHTLPLLEEQIQKKLDKIQAELDRYDSGLPTEPNQRKYFLIDKITEFTKDAINLTIGENLLSMPHVNIFSNLRKYFDEWKSDLDQSGIKFNRIIEMELHEYEKKYRGREIPGFLNYKTFEVILKDQLKKLEEPAIRKLKEISGLIRNEFIQLAQSSFPGFPNLLKIAMNKIENIKQINESEAESMLKTQFKMELMIWSQDSIYKDTLCMQKNQEEEEERKNFGVPRHASHNLYDYSDREAALEELMRHLKTYYFISSKRLADQVPLVIRYMVVQESAIQLEREMLQLIQGNINIDELLKEDHDITSKQNNLKSHQKRLTDAHKNLVDFYNQLQCKYTICFERIIKVWPLGADSVLQDRFHHTEWSMFASEATYGTHTDINTYTSSVLDYINTTIDSVTTEKQITTYPNQKPWMNKEVQLLLKARLPVYGSNTIIKFADDTTVIGLISNNNETAYRAEVQHLVAWCADSNLLLNTSKMKKLIIDFRREKGRTNDPIHINGMAVECVSIFKFLGTHISEDLSWTTNTSSLVKKAHQRLFYLNTLKKNHLSSNIMVNFHRCAIESILTNCITVWYGNCSVTDRKALQ
ncbi:hypothetical protein QTP70_027108 [Hemibagrus guttatus]|uniref:Uncharacterized protein n=1 Tax=Hemibagrus guttatus TaxID=175788 RepID=A0AAE0PZC5_9TELE|nr:hypothetical protein QTP70_027108 [Hemibagrus guttatus]